MSRSDGFGLEVSKGFAAKILLAVVGFLGSVVFARVLGPVEYGAFHVVVAVANILDNPISGIGAACKKRISEHGQDEGQILSIGLSVAAILGLVVGTAMLVIGPQLNYFEIGNGPFYVTVVFLALIFFKILQPLVAGKGQFGTAVVLDSVRSVLTIPLQLFLVFLGWGVAGMVYGLTVATLLTVPLGIYVLDVRPTVPRWDTVRSVWKFAKYSLPTGFVGTAYSRLDILLLGAVLGSGASGQYKVALQLVLPGAMLSMVMGSGLFAEVSALSSRGEEVATKVTNNVAFASLLTIPLFFGALAMPESIVVTVFGAEYRSAATLLVGLALYQVIAAQSNQIKSVVQGLDRPDIMFYIMAATLVTNLALGVPLVYEIGAMGAVIATVTAEAVKFVLMTFFARKRVPYEVLPAPVRYEILAGAVMFIVVDISHRMGGVSSWFELLAIVSLGALVYGVVLALASDIFLRTAKGIIADARNQ